MNYKPKLNPGDTASIYQKPFTNEDFEGNARLKKFLHAQEPDMEYWTVRLSERKGQPCRIVTRGRMNSICVEFEDGSRVITSRYAVRKRR